MSLFNLRKKNTETKSTPQKGVVKTKFAAMGAVGGGRVSNQGVLMRPHVTEKAAASGEKGVYVFRVAMNANKLEIARSVAALYKVNPIKVTIAPIPKKRITVKGHPGFRRGGKKACVFLKKGEKIELV